MFFIDLMMSDFVPPPPHIYAHSPRSRSSSESVFDFATAIANLPPEEVKKMKLLYLKNAIADYQESLSYRKFFVFSIPLLVFVILVCFITDSFFVLMPILFLLFSFFWYSAHKSRLRKMKQKINNALEIWHDDLGDDYYHLSNELKSY